MTHATVKPDPRIAAYVAELEGPCPVVNYSHLTLLALHQQHGKVLIENLLEQYWHARRAPINHEEKQA
jgi:hypothetical protein